MALDYTPEVQGVYGEAGGVMLAGFWAHESALREAVNYVYIKKSSSNAPITGTASSVRMSKARFLLGAYASGKAGLVGFIRRHGISSLTLIVHLEMINTAMNGAPIRNQMAQLQVSSRRSLQAVRKSQVASLHCQRVR